MELDGLRALAFGLVFLQHTVAIPLTWSGVDLFFVLSGYLITGILIREQGTKGHLKAFYLRRTLRIFPAYYASIALAALLLPAAAGAAPFAIVYLGNVHRTLFGDGYPLTPLWSLAVEEQFYLLWPLVLMVTPPRIRWRLILVLLAAAPLLRAFLTIGINELAAQSLLPGRMDILAAGAALALIEYSRGRDIFSRYLRWCAAGMLVAGAAFGALAMASPHDSLWYTVGVLELDLLFYSLVLVVVLGSLGHKRMAWLKWRPLVYLGQISYGLYLLHVPAIFVARQFFDGAIANTVAGAATVLLASLSWRWFERPIMRWGRAHSDSLSTQPSGA